MGVGVAGRELAWRVSISGALFGLGDAEAVDDALGERSTDPVIHAAALWLAFATRSDLRLSRSRARGWVLGLHELVDSGHLDAAAFALPKLMAEFPERPYLENMAFVFAHLPPAVGEGREQFVDDPSSDVQTVRTSGADTVVIDFCGASHGPGLSIYLLDRWFAQLGCHVIYLRDRQKIGYAEGITALGTDMTSSIAALKRLVKQLGADRVVCLGNSAGASGALRYAGPLGADRVLALAPITGGPKFARNAAAQVPPGGALPWGDLVPLYRDAEGVRAHIVYGADNAGDREQCGRMAGLPGVTIEALPGWETHHLVHGLLRAGRLVQLLDWLKSDADDEIDELTSSMMQPTLR